MNIDQFVDWLCGTEKQCVYYVSQSKPDKMTSDQRKALDRAWSAALERQVYLFQRRRGDTVEYIAVRANGRVPERLAPYPPEANDNTQQQKGKAA